MWLLLACTSDPVVLLEADATRDGLDGADGPLAVSRVDRVYPTRVSDAVETIVVYPTEIVAGTPTVVLDHGGLVDADRYVWLATHLASRGYVVALPRFPMLLAITAPGNGVAALDGVLGDTVGAALPAAVGGHSLGGVTGAMAWVTEPRFTGVYLLASFAAADTDVESRTDGSVLSLIGDQDGSADMGETVDGYARFAAPGLFGVVSGLTHYGWTDDVTESEAAKEDTPNRPVDEARRDSLRVFDAWIDATLRDDADAQALLDAGVFANVEVSK
jgi:hypothetical protein